METAVQQQHQRQNVNTAVARHPLQAVVINLWSRMLKWFSWTGRNYLKVEQRMMWHSSQVTWPTSLNRLSSHHSHQPPCKTTDDVAFQSGDVANISYRLSSHHSHQPPSKTYINTSCLITRTMLHLLIIITYMNVCPSFVSKWVSLDIYMQCQNHEDVSMLPGGRGQCPLEGSVRQVRWPYCWWQTVPCGWFIHFETLLSSCSRGAWNPRVPVAADRRCWRSEISVVGT